MKCIPRSTATYAILVDLLLLLSAAWAQQNPPALPKTGQTPNAAAAPADQAPPDNPTSAAGPASTPAAATDTGKPAPSTKAVSNSSNPPPAPSPTTRSSTPNTIATITPTGAVQSTQSAPPSITGHGSSATGLPKGLPTLSGAYSYPPPTVPPTAGAPFLQHSKLPEGTVFIIVGACLGFLGCCIVAWRILIAWSVHRSVERAALRKNMADATVKLQPRGSGFYAAGPGSSLSLDHLSSNVRASSYGPKSHLANGGLFYSPTARGSTALDPSANRASSYLPAGYYAAGASAPGGGASSLHLGTLPAHHTARGRTAGTSPPASPNLSPGPQASHVIFPSHPSTSSLNLSVPPQGRAPSAYLEDLFASHQTHRGSQDRS
ncbi:MAG: hypothetical protein M1826_001009 [Phylliscum demangeonii]|nr:MAG: hypothetical protein M1826_001009 [Phylliscum demangeonii]